MRRALTEMTDEYYVANAMAKIPQAPSSDLVSLNFFLPFLLVQIFSLVFLAIRPFHMLALGQG
jgi:hypothetical protein